MTLSQDHLEVASLLVCGDRPGPEAQVLRDIVASGAMVKVRRSVHLLDDEGKQQQIEQRLERSIALAVDRLISQPYWATITATFT